MIRHLNNQSAVSRLRPVDAVNYLLIIEERQILKYDKGIYVVTPDAHEKIFSKVINAGLDMGYARIFENRGSFFRIRLTKIPRN